MSNLIIVFSRSIPLTVFILVSVFISGCNNDKHSSIKEKTVFATLIAPSTTQDVQTMLSDFTVQVKQMHTQIMTAQALDWEHDIIPLNDLLKKLDDANKYNTQLMNKSPDSELRNLAYLGYQQYPLLIESLIGDIELITIVKTSLKNLTPKTPRQEEAANYLSSIENKYSSDELVAIAEVNEELTSTSLEYYNNTFSKSSSGTFTPEEFSCLSEDLLSKFLKNSSGNFIYDSLSFYPVNLYLSCLDDEVREKINAIENSKSAKENSLLWPSIMMNRLSYAQLKGYDNFASDRLSNTMLKNVENIRVLLDNVDNITAPAFEQLGKYFKDIQMAEYGMMPNSVTRWNWQRYSSAVKHEIYGPKVDNPYVLKFPETFDRMLYLVGKILGLNFVKKGTLENSWNPEVIEYLVYDLDTNNSIGTLLLDPYQVKGTNNVPNASILMSPRLLDSGERQQPIVVLNSNINKSITGTTYISSKDYKDFGHELGHALHFLLKAPTASYKSDFVEIPSTFIEELVQNTEFLKALLSPEPDEPLEQLSDEFVNYWNYYRNSAISIADNERHTLTLSATSIDVTAWQGDEIIYLHEAAKINQEKYFYTPANDSKPFYDKFYFINPGTDARYYQYVLAKVIAMDILSLFKSSPESVFNQELGRRYRHEVLVNCGPDTEASITNFLGRKWNYDAYKKWFDEKTDVLF